MVTVERTWKMFRAFAHTNKGVFQSDPFHTFETAEDALADLNRQLEEAFKKRAR